MSTTNDDFFQELKRSLDSLSNDFKSAFEKVAEEAEYRIDKEIGKQLAKHPELYADLKRGYRQFQKFTDKVAEDLGLK